IVRDAGFVFHGFTLSLAGRLLVHVAAFGDRDHEHGNGLIVDRINDAQVAEAIAVGTGELPFERLDVVAFAWVRLKRLETPRELFRDGPVTAIVESLRLQR